eukprot:scaffold11876_cov98-Skeletonema_dohrnii-CCMP3373.AAC.3
MPSTSSNPSASISLQPSSSMEPSGGPTLFPTISASASPSHEPSMEPSVSFEPSSSKQPSGGPTLLPTISAPPSHQPSKSPSVSSNPSLSSSPSGLPSFAPSTKIPSGSPIVGVGDCGSRSDCDDPSDPLSYSQAPQLSDVFPYVMWVFELGIGDSGSSACASKCMECVSVDGAVSDGSFKGFTLFYGNMCACHMNHGATYNPGAGCTDGEFICNGGFLGIGEILGAVDYGIGAPVCCKYKLPE